MGIKQEINLEWPLIGNENLVEGTVCPFHSGCAGTCHEVRFKATCRVFNL